MSISGYRNLYKVKWWGWDGQSREIDPFTGDAIESINTDFIRAFFEEDVWENFEKIYGWQPDENKVVSVELATDDEEEAWGSGYVASMQKNNEAYHYEYN